MAPKKSKKDRVVKPKDAIRPSAAKFEAMGQLALDLFNSTKLRGFEIPNRDVRYLVDLYYQVQEFRKATGNQRRASKDDASEPVNLVDFFLDVVTFTEHQIARALAAWVEKDPVSTWATSIVGVGPVLAAGLAAHFDIKLCPKVSSLWRFAGLDPTSVWEPKKKRPWNARLKQICFLIGDSFVKNSGDTITDRKTKEVREKDHPSFYALEYKKWKAIYNKRNETGVYAADAAKRVEEKRFKSGTDALVHCKEGHLPPFVLEWRARRKAVKLFLSHYWETAYRHHYKKDPPPPYAITVLGHTGLVTVEDVEAYENQEGNTEEEGRE